MREYIYIYIYNILKKSNQIIYKKKIVQRRVKFNQNLCSVGFILFYYFFWLKVWLLINFTSNNHIYLHTYNKKKFVIKKIFIGYKKKYKLNNKTSFFEISKINFC